MRDTNRVLIIDLIYPKEQYIQKLKSLGFREVYHKYSDKGDNIEVLLKEHTFGFVDDKDLPSPTECSFMSLSMLERRLESNISPSDVVNHPRHYNIYPSETIDAIRSQMTSDEFLGYCKGNIFKYISRFKFKNGLEDLKKANWYLKKMIEEQEHVNQKG